jgi:hypothetical protein
VAGSGKFTFVLSERDLCVIADALDLAVDKSNYHHVGAFTRSDFANLAKTIDERLHY